jgi:hypothetical protein
MIGTTAIYKDSSCFVSWASKCSVKLGWLDVANKGLGQPTIGNELSPIGSAGTNGVLSLGDAGEAILTFDYPISNGQGPDFAVFENGFNNTFLELAFVEVSSDGNHFVRFPSVSLSDTTVQFDNNASMDATKLYNLAGKYKANYGTPFDLEELKDSIGLNLKSITHVKIIDVVGSVNPLFGTRDSKNHLINDPYPTPFPSAGFDLDAVGVIHSETLGLAENNIQIQLFPNPTKSTITVNAVGESIVELFDLQGNKLYSSEFMNVVNLDLTGLPKGVYFVVTNGVGKKVLLED